MHEIRCLNEEMEELAVFLSPSIFKRAARDPSPVTVPGIPTECI
ncbi:hypothetical protein [Variovorax sp. J22R115]|nr:hypothetical protein [Variovorax sp. J22R115]MDM0050422.1 hypothetical protein [Variovorax sp. J22R115]